MVEFVFEMSSNGGRYPLAFSEFQLVQYYMASIISLLPIADNLKRYEPYC